MTTPFVGINVGDKFSDLSILKQKISDVQSQSHVQLYIRDSRTLCGSKKIPKIVSFTPPHLKYHTLIYSCKLGGKYFKPNGQGIRNSKTYRQNCPAEIRFGLSDDLQQLQVKSIVDEHNHEVSERSYHSFGRQMRQSLKGAIRAKPNKDDVIQTVKLMDEHGSLVRVFKEGDLFLGLMYQDECMQKAYDTYPEILIDGSYKLNYYLLLYAFYVIDGNGNADVACIFIIQKHGEMSLMARIDAFKNGNKAWPYTQLVITRKDMITRHVLKEQFSSASIQLVMADMLPCFKEQIMKSKGEPMLPRRRGAIMEALTGMADAYNEEVYTTQLDYFLSQSTVPIIDYFYGHWAPIRHEWVNFLKSSNFEISEHTNQKLQHVGGKIKDVCSQYYGLKKFTLSLFDALRSWRDEKRAEYQVDTRILTETYSKDEADYQAYVTQFAFGIVLRQIHLINQVSLPISNYITTIVGCNCTFYVTKRLPCHHLLAVRMRNHLALFDPSIVAERWTSTFYVELLNLPFMEKSIVTEDPSEVIGVIDGKDNVKDYLNTIKSKQHSTHSFRLNDEVKISLPLFLLPGEEELTSIAAKPKKKKAKGEAALSDSLLDDEQQVYSDNQHLPAGNNTSLKEFTLDDSKETLSKPEKYQQAYTVCEQLATLVSDSTFTFHRKVALLKQLLQSWSEGKSPFLCNGVYVQTQGEKTPGSLLLNSSDVQTKATRKKQMNTTYRKRKKGLVRSVEGDRSFEGPATNIHNTGTTNEESLKARHVIDVSPLVSSGGDAAPPSITLSAPQPAPQPARRSGPRYITATSVHTPYISHVDTHSTMRTDSVELLNAAAILSTINTDDNCLTQNRTHVSVKSEKIARTDTGVLSDHVYHCDRDQGIELTLENHGTVIEQHHLQPSEEVTVTNTPYEQTSQSSVYVTGVKQGDVPASTHKIENKPTGTYSVTLTAEEDRIMRGEMPDSDAMASDSVEGESNQQEPSTYVEVVAANQQNVLELSDSSETIQTSNDLVMDLDQVTSSDMKDVYSVGRRQKGDSADPGADFVGGIVDTPGVACEVVSYIGEADTIYANMENS